MAGGTDYRDDEHFAACTKIYLRPRNMALTSEANYSTNEIKHGDFELAMTDDERRDFENWQQRNRPL